MFIHSCYSLGDSILLYMKTIFIQLIAIYVLATKLEILESLIEFEVAQSCKFALLFLLEGGIEVPKVELPWPVSVPSKSYVFPVSYFGQTNNPTLARLTSRLDYTTMNSTSYNHTL
ncbi:hypothetical protein VNO77_42288 [Canavalia gladiata]|uniref:Uncharacterized protein n=1 Tax=Canavalia gladiata TaxID=3824 RepID=A0AAN9K2E4_CANGL